MLTVPPMIAIDNPRVVEGTDLTPGATTPMEFTVSLTKPSTKEVSVNYQTVNRTAIAGLDYVPTSGTLKFAPGERSKTIVVDIVPDNVIEPTETLGMRLSGARNGMIIVSQGVGMILDDDTPIDPALSVFDAEIRRGPTGTTRQLNFTVSLNTQVSQPVTVTASTRVGTAQAGTDFNSKTETLTFQPGQTTRTFSVTVRGDSSAPIVRWFYVDLSSGNVPLQKSTAIGLLHPGS